MNNLKIILRTLKDSKQKREIRNPVQNTERSKKMPSRLKVLPRDLNVFWYPGNRDRKPKKSQEILAKNKPLGKVMGCMVLGKCQYP